MSVSEVTYKLAILPNYRYIQLNNHLQLNALILYDGEAKQEVLYLNH